MGDRETRAKLDEHWVACDAGDQDKLHSIYHNDVVVEWPQSGERVRGRANLQALRESHPNELRFRVRRIVGEGDLWVTEYLIDYDGRPVHTVSVMEFRDGLVARETHHFADPFEPPEWRARWVETESREEGLLRRVRAIPAGRVTTYGDLSPGAPRYAGQVLSDCDEPDVPWQRVVRADGSLAKGERQRALLEAEGVPFRGERVDMHVAWAPPPG